MVNSRNDLTDFQKLFAIDHAPVPSFVEASRTLKPTGIIGVSTVPKLFNQQVIEAMSANQRTADHLPVLESDIALRVHGRRGVSMVKGRAIFASGSPFAPVEIEGATFVPGQGNNVYIFPAMGMAVFATEATRVTEEMFIVAAKAVAEQVRTKASRQA